MRRCWGWNRDGQLGLGDVNDRGDAAGEVRSLTRTALDLMAVNLVLLFALRQSTGSNAVTWLQVASLADVDLGPGRTAVQLAVGGYHTCALLDDGHLCAPRPLSPPLDRLRQPGLSVRRAAGRCGARVGLGSASAALIP